MSSTVVLRPGQEKEVNSAQARKCKIYQNRGFIKILGEEGAKVRESRSKIQEEVPVSPPVTPVVIPEPEKVDPVLESQEEEEEEVPVAEVIEDTPQVDLDSLGSMSYSDIKTLAESLDIKGRGKDKLIEAIKDHFNNG